MNLPSLQNHIGNIDIYLLDQILKGRYTDNANILDAGCGMGRNLKWFYNNNFNIYGIDNNTQSIEFVKSTYPKASDNFSVNQVENIQYENDKFDHVICNAVLHFAKDKAHFYKMFDELIRVLKPKGSLFIRMTSNFGIEHLVAEQTPDVYLLPDQSLRFLLTKNILEKLFIKHDITLLEPSKTVNVQNLRCMTTLVLRKM